jgi:hypothetical protein
MPRKRDIVKSTLKTEVSLPRKISIDILGVLLIVGSIAFGWLPGVGGIPLFIAGLSLLATNHTWAKKILLKIKDRGNQVVKKIFRDHPILVIIYDILAIILLVLAGLVFYGADGNFIRSSAFILLFFGSGLFIGNRHRIEHINNFINKIKN